MKNILQTCLFIILVSLTLISNVFAENVKKMGSMQVHYMAINATFLTPKIAKAYNIERSRFNGLINISVLDDSEESRPAKAVSIQGKARNDIGQIKTLEFDEVKEGDAIYYLAQVNYTNEETFYFDITISDGKETHQLKFKQKFYVD
ncbi:MULTISPECIES: DUF4426 domain-containing protein [unclassified Colwellia]|jgi:hypothetical protein|uniref:DUF4426 domain-containing protein n=1 Tax=unclassified Colwellia TaxID=196834 RepID=UPI0015F71D09|nr:MULTISPECIES: DUF4426 domain-containing protein [unclassified Colwellia]MBA6231724.1 DUF4426 domain-containing protein [Colwellia sp. MB02u-7]MBA6235588.1 DUF4426 domain-containing protein [Colwellia sp. MB02u-11]MBA6254899.1 DUF4426 domain-containing protein [Colwellia sp. MB3u-28]MBA6259681.1 DUF4426 domain-containing protein [Colwellia sp. MB3u-41]MBA6299576.1 DUF4426 domain-containing protein [Colwellia sp. MB3u-22]